MCEICSKLTIKTPDQHHRYCSSVFIVNLEQISYTVIVELEQVNADWEIEELKQVQLQWTPSIYKWKLQTKIVLNVPML